MEKYFKINAEGCSICCKLYSDGARQFDRVIIAPHGFAGHKDSKATARFAERVLSKYKRIAVLCYDQPCHGDDVRQHLCLADCDMYLGRVLEYSRSTLGAKELYCYATSFGGYLSLKYMAEHGDPFVRTVLRCPAVNMPEVLWNTILSDTERELLSNGKSAEAGFDRKVRIDAAFVKELREKDMRKLDFIELSENILIINAGKDEVVPPAEIMKFADDNLIELVTVPKADHRFSDPVILTEAIKTALEFFAL